MEDIAATARVSVATAYNHFDGKHALLAHVYAPLLLVELEASRLRWERGDLTVETALELHVRDLVRMIYEHETLTVALTYAMHDREQRLDGRAWPDQPCDASRLDQLATELVWLVGRGQRLGVFREFPSAETVGAIARNQLVANPIVNPGQPVELAAEIVLTTLFGILQPEMLAHAGPTGRPFAVSSTADA
jgi:AcrR family transcriptional regulator